MFTYSHVKWFYGQSEHVYYLNYFIKNNVGARDIWNNLGERGLFLNENDVAISKYNYMPMLCFYNL